MREKAWKAGRGKTGTWKEEAPENQKRPSAARGEWSILMLFSRGVIYKLLLLLAAMAAVQTTLFCLVYRAGMRLEDTMRGYSLEYVLACSRVEWVCGIGFLLLTVILCLQGCEFSSKSHYTMGRLSVSESRISWLRSGFHCCCYFLFLAMQVLILYGICRLYLWMIAADGYDVIGDQTIMLAFWRSPFLHSLLPVGESSRMLRNLLLIAALGFGSARVPDCQRSGQRCIAIIILTGLTLLFFCDEMGNRNMDLLACRVLAVILAGVIVRKGVFK
ncbi:MAG: hypothetical protein IJ468_01420 [Lachnospiraceae bacterium]|nr:hypothetical protein [Lachnospiraceae bacterium]